MKRQIIMTGCGIAAVILAIAAPLYAQRIDTIRANPDAVPLLKIWEVTGGEFGGGRVGDGIGSVGDINGDGLDDWAVHYGDANEWHIFYGSRDSALSTEPVVILDSLGAVPAYPVVGDFWGTGHKAVGFPSGSYIGGRYYYGIRFYRTDSSRLDTVPSTILSLYSINPPVTSIPVSVSIVDMEADGYDDIAMMFAGRTVNGVSTRKPEVWIYRGGSEFKVDSPTVVLYDEEQNGGRGAEHLVIADADGDGRADLITGSDYADGTQKQKFFFSNPGSPWNWSEPDRVVQMSNFVPLDCDGDSLLDLAVGGPGANVSLFLSSTGKNARTRTLTFDDADLQYAPYASALALGYLSDSSRRYQMLGILGDGTKRGFSGSPSGPDPLWDAYSGEEWGYHRPVGDITGDGWSELMTGKPIVNFNSGFAAIYAGGPYIPRDPTLGVRHIASEERSDAITVWPNPATTELHVAWRGDLKRMPRRFEVHDLLGRLIARGDVESWRGEALWQCDRQPAGVYLLSIMDYRGEPIATTRIIKQ